MTVQKGRARVAANAAIAGSRCDTFRANPQPAMTARSPRHNDRAHTTPHAGSPAGCSIPPRSARVAIEGR
ncbi:hypothetical protein BURMUCGD1_3639 [Burkholderia multivorans CGD1]|nr:hypothetical protein BURMUCGD1_3639 [Burkholderia multivorans CGD1]